MSKNLILFSFVFILIVGIVVSSDAITYRWYWFDQSGGDVWTTTNTSFGSWSRAGSTGYNARGAATGPDGTVYIACDNGSGRIMKSTNNGASWSFVGNSGAQNRGITVTKDGTIYVCREDRYIMKSTNGGSSWSNVSQPDRTPRGISSDRNNYLYLAVEDESGRMYKSTNSGSSWSDMGKVWGSWSAMEGGNCHVEYYDPIVVDNNNYVYMISEDNTGRVYRSTNGGSSWSHVGTVGEARGIAAARNGYVVIGGKSAQEHGTGWTARYSSSGGSWGAESGMVPGDASWPRQIEAWPRLNCPPAEPTLTAPSTGETNKNRITISWQFNDPEGDPQATYEVKVGSSAGAQDGWYTGQVNSSATSVTTPTLADGTWYISIRTKDNQGDWGEWMTGDYTFTVATEVHVYLDAITSPTNDITVSVSGTAIVGPPGAATIDEAHFRVDAGAWFETTPDDGTFNEDIEDFYFTTFPLLDGVHTIEARAIDSNVNESDYASLSVTVDTREPNSELNPITSPTNINPPTITGTATD